MITLPARQLVRSGRVVRARKVLDVPVATVFSNVAAGSHGIFCAILRQFFKGLPILMRFPRKYYPRPRRLAPAWAERDEKVKLRLDPTSTEGFHQVEIAIVLQHGCTSCLVCFIWS